MIIKSQPYKLPRSVYQRYVAACWMRRRWWLVAVPLTAAAVASAWLSDPRWLLVLLMYLFIVTPAILSMAYFTYLLTPEARLTALMKQVAIEPGRRLVITYERPRPQDEPAGDTATRKDRIPPDEEIDWSEIKGIKVSGGNYAFELRDKRWPRFLLVPRKALDSLLPSELLF